MFLFVAIINSTLYNLLLEISSSGVFSLDVNSLSELLQKTYMKIKDPKAGMISSMEKQAYPFTPPSGLEVEPQVETTHVAVTEWDSTTFHQTLPLS